MGRPEQTYTVTYSQHIGTRQTSFLIWGSCLLHGGAGVYKIVRNFRNKVSASQLRDELFSPSAIHDGPPYIQNSMYQPIPDVEEHGNPRATANITRLSIPLDFRGVLEQYTPPHLQPIKLSDGLKP